MGGDLIEEGSRVGDLGVADLDGDGALDGLVAAEEGFFVVWGIGEAAPTVTYAPEADPANAVAAVADGGTVRAAVAVEGMSPQLRLYEAGMGGGVVQVTGTALEKDAVDLAAADLDDDGLMEVLVAEAGTASRVRRYTVEPGPGLVEGGFLLEGGRFGGVAVETFGLDEFPDVAVSNNLTDRVFILLGGMNGSFSTSDIFVPGEPAGLATGVFDGDSFADLAVASPGLSRLYLFRGDGGGNLVAPQPLSAPAGAHAVAAGDFDGDGGLDVAVAGHDAGVVWLYAYDGAAETFAFVAEAVDVGEGVSALAAGDVTGDGVDDLVVGTDFIGTLWVVPAQP